MADYQDLPTEGGWVQKIVGGDTYGVIFQERAITAMHFVGSPLVFRMDPIDRAIGAYAPQSVVGYRGLIFFLAEDGFYAFDGSGTRPIGHGKVDRYFFRNLLPGTHLQIVGALDSVNKIVAWAYTSTDGTPGVCDRILIYKWALERWAEVSGASVEYLWRAITGGYTMDGLDAITTNLDLLSPDLDSRFWAGNQFMLTSTNSQHQLGLYNGSALPATIETGEFQPFQNTNQLAFLSSVRPLIEGGSAEFGVVVNSRNSLTQSGSQVAAVASLGDGIAPLRAVAAYHRVTVSTSANFEHALGVEVYPIPAGQRRGQ
jgi:hypothetical protein